MKYYQTQRNAGCTTNLEKTARSLALGVLAAPEVSISNTAIPSIYSIMSLVVWGVWGVNASIFSLEEVALAGNTSGNNNKAVVKACIKMMRWYKN